MRTGVDQPRGRAGGKHTSLLRNRSGRKSSETTYSVSPWPLPDSLHALCRRRVPTQKQRFLGTKATL